MNLGAYVLGLVLVFMPWTLGILYLVFEDNTNPAGPPPSENKDEY